MDMTVRLQGGTEALRALRTLEPTVARHTAKTISEIGADLAATIRMSAKADPPVSGWRATPSGWPAWSQVQATSKRRGAGIIVTTSSTDLRIAAMYEYVGNATKIKDQDKGARLSRMFNARLGSTVKNSKRKAPGRLAVRIITEEYPKVIEQIKKACDDAVAEVNRRMP